MKIKGSKLLLQASIFCCISTLHSSPPDPVRNSPPVYGDARLTPPHAWCHPQQLSDKISLFFITAAFCISASLAFDAVPPNTFGFASPLYGAVAVFFVWRGQKLDVLSPDVCNKIAHYIPDAFNLSRERVITFLNSFRYALLSSSVGIIANIIGLSGVSNNFAFFMAAAILYAPQTSIYFAHFLLELIFRREPIVLNVVTIPAGRHDGGLVLPANNEPTN